MKLRGRSLAGLVAGEVVAMGFGADSGSENGGSKSPAGMDEGRDEASAKMSGVPE